MNWEAIAAVGEIVGAVATSTYESVMTGFNDINIIDASNPALATLLDRGCQDPGTLDTEDMVQFNFLLRCYANQWWKMQWPDQLL